MGRHLVIANPASGGGRAPEQVERALARLATTGETYETLYTRQAGDGVELAREHGAGYDTVIAAGGDGTLGEVITGLLTDEGQLAVAAFLPMGTANQVALTLGMRDHDAVLRAIRGDACRTIDVLETTFRVGEETERRMVLIGVGLGFPAAVLQVSTRRIKKLLGRWSYVYATLAKALTFAPPHLTVTIDGETREGRYLLGGIVNMACAGGDTVLIAPEAKVDDGAAEVVLARDAGRLGNLRLLPRLRDGGHLSMPQVELVSGHEVGVESDLPTPLNVDGELLGTTPLTVSIRPAALRLKVAAAAS